MKKNNIMRKSVKLFLAPFIFLLGACKSFGACKEEGVAMMNSGYTHWPNSYASDASPARVDTNSYTEIKENNFINTSENNKSTFSLCSSTGAYTNLKNLVMNYGTMPDKNAVIIEQMLNYFDYSYEPNENETLAIFNEVSDCPWNSDHKLASIAVKAKDAEVPPGNNNFVFLIDVSGSMYSVLDMVKSSFEILTRNLSDNDRVSIVTYANGVSTVLDGASGKDRDLIISKVNGLMANGGTNGSGGIQKAYEIARKHFINDGNNRVILATDGDFNIGISDQTELQNYIADKRDSGIYLSILGFGMGNYHSDTAETLAKNGNGNMFYIDSERTANKLFGQDLMAAFEVVAKDTKTQVTFDSNQVASYRLLGYENALLSDDDFNNTQKDAGEILSGDVTVAMYEIVLNENADLTQSLFTSEIHYKDPKTSVDKELKNENAIYSATKSDDFVFQALVVEYGLVLRDSQYKGDATYNHVIGLYEEKSSIFNRDDNRKEFYNLVRATKALKNGN